MKKDGAQQDPFSMGWKTVSRNCLKHLRSMCGFIVANLAIPRIRYRHGCTKTEKNDG